MLEMGLTPATVVIAALVLLWAVWAVRRLRGRGLCDCHDHDGGGAKGPRWRLGLFRLLRLRRGRSHGGRNGPSPAGERTYTYIY